MPQACFFQLWPKVVNECQHRARCRLHRVIKSTDLVWRPRRQSKEFDVRSRAGSRKTGERDGRTPGTEQTAVHPYMRGRFKSWVTGAIVLIPASHLFSFHLDLIYRINFRKDLLYIRGLDYRNVYAVYTFMQVR